MRGLREEFEHVTDMIRKLNEGCYAFIGMLITKESALNQKRDQGGNMGKLHYLRKTDRLVRNATIVDERGISCRSAGTTQRAQSPSQIEAILKQVGPVKGKVAVVGAAVAHLLGRTVTRVERMKMPLEAAMLHSSRIASLLVLTELGASKISGISTRVQKQTWLKVRPCSLNSTKGKLKSMFLSEIESRRASWEKELYVETLFLTTVWYLYSWKKHFTSLT